MEAINEQWLKRKAEQEVNCCISVGGLVTRVKEMEKIIEQEYGPLSGNKRNPLPESALYYLANSRLGTPEERLFSMREAYNHVVNALYAEAAKRDEAMEALKRIASSDPGPAYYIARAALEQL